MVHLILSSTKGNQGLRYFPYSGYLGLTPIRVEGIVRTKLDADQRTLQAKSITISVRCYESRIGRTGTSHSNILVDYTQVLWQKSSPAEYDPIANLEFPFRINIPPKVAGFSTTVFVDYRCMWRVEAVLMHIPVTGVGARQVRHFELPLVRYDLPPLPPPMPAPECDLAEETSKPRAPRIRYAVHAPKTPIGPLDLVSIPIHLQPLDPGVAIRSASVIVERRIVLHDTPSYTNGASPVVTLQPNPSTSSLTKQPSPSPFLQPSFLKSHDPAPDRGDPHYAAASGSTLSLGSSVPTITPGTFYPSAVSLATTSASETTPLLPSNHPSTPNGSTPSLSSAKVIVNPIAGAESSGSFARDARGRFSKTLTLQWPAAKSHSRWAIGETLASDLVRVTYVVRTKIVVTAPGGGAESLELADRELCIVSTNAAERELALARWAEAHDAAAASSGDAMGRSKSKSPRRSARDLAAAMGAGEIPPSPGVTNITNLASASSLSASTIKPPKSSSAAMRRPHTSAGPRDRPANFSPTGASGGGSTSANGSGSGSSGKRRSDLGQRPDTSQALGRAGGLLGGGRSAHSFWSTVHSNGTNTNGSSSGTRSAGASVGGGGGGGGKLKEAPSGSSTSDGGTTRSTSGSSVASVSSAASASSSRERAAQRRRRANPNASDTALSLSLSLPPSSFSPPLSATTATPGPGPVGEHMREWEEELARIEARSRRSSDLAGFSGKRKRSVGAPSAPSSASASATMPVPVPAVPRVDGRVGSGAHAAASSYGTTGSGMGMMGVSAPSSTASSFL